MPITILQLTDCHLFADPAARLKGVPTTAALEDVLALVRGQFADADRLILTGDLAHDDLVDTYRMLREMLGEFVARCRVIPGNHDSRDALREVFGDRVPDNDGPVTFRDEVGNWRLIGLDSQESGQVHGRVGGEQLEWLEGELAEDTGRPVMVFMHHPPVAVGSRWLDGIGLLEPERLHALIAASPQVRAICTGHVHQSFEGRLAHSVVYSTPSTAVQFRARTDSFQLDAIAPGFRVIELSEGAMQSQVVRVRRLRYPPVAE